MNEKTNIDKMDDFYRGSTVTHKISGKTGRVLSVQMMAEPMFRVRFGADTGIYKMSEIEYDVIATVNENALF